MKRLGIIALSLVGLGVFGSSLSNVPASSRSTGQPENVIAQSLAASIQLYAEREGGVHRWASGVAVASSASGHVLILTAAHLLTPQAAQTVYAITPGSNARVEARVLGIDEAADVALLSAELGDITPVGLQAGARLGDNVWVVSFPWGRRGTVVSGVVSQIVTADADMQLLVSGPVALIDAAVSYGTSGGGVFDARSGKLVGIVRSYRTAKLSLPGTPAQSLELPIAGETTVVPVSQILCVLRQIQAPDSAGLEGFLADAPADTCSDSI